MGDDAVDVEAGRLFEDHLTFDEMALGVKEGKYFQGRLMVSRLISTEATVKVAGLNQELLLPDLGSTNRALNGDIVCLEVLPETQWIAEYKGEEPVVPLLDDPQEAEKAIQSEDEDAEDNSQAKQIKKNLILWVNSETKRRVTAKVKGVLKKMNKTRPNKSSILV